MARKTRESGTIQTNQNMNARRSRRETAHRHMLTGDVLMAPRVPHVPDKVVRAEWEMGRPVHNQF